RIGRNRRNGVLVNQLRRPSLTLQQHAEIIEPGDDALELHAVHKKYGQGCFAFPYGVEENVLQVLFFVRRHEYSEPSLCWGLDPRLDLQASKEQWLHKAAPPGRRKVGRHKAGMAPEAATRG